MDFNELKVTLSDTNVTQKIEVLSYLSDVFESYNKNIERFEEIVYFLIDLFIVEQNIEIKCEIVETLVNAGIYQEINSIDWSKIEENLEYIPAECLSRCIDILGFSHNSRYLETIKGYRRHDDENVRESVEEAIREILECRQ